jgi:cytochrome P450
MAKITPPEIKAYFQFVQDSINERSFLQEELREKPETEQRLDMFHFLRESKNPDTGAPAYSPAELWAEANMLIIAGADTTAVSLCGIFFYLVRDNIRLDKLAHEIRSTFASANDITPGQKLQSCIYLRACIDEGLRLAPAGPSETGREIKPGGATINGIHYPAGTVVGVAAWAQTRNEVYGDPLVFRPERWIVDTANGITEESVALCRNNFPFFGRGPGSCPGKNVALLELMLTIAKTLHRLDIRAAVGDTLGEGSPDKQWGQQDRNILQMRDAYISILEGPTVQFRKKGI